jgi:sterol desaturase/sphingolipid hydroxylase (fatty acid hydroxylase superfamily)
MASSSPRRASENPGAARTWTSGFRRLSPDQVRIVGPVTLAIYDASRPQIGQPRMFPQHFLEWLTVVHPLVLPAIYLPAAVYFLFDGWLQGVSPITMIGLFAGGVAFWTFFEYLMHRFSFHFAPSNRVGLVFAYLVHGVHHAYPEDRRRWVMPPAVSAPIVLMFYFVLRAVSVQLYGPLLAGGLLGYLWYDLLHYALHRAPMKSHILNDLRKHHLQHHYVTPERQFGVSTTFWDHVFRTMR